MKKQSLKIRLMGGIAISVFASSNALATKFDIPRGNLAKALDDFQEQSGVSLIVAANEVKSVKSGGIKGDLPADAALSKLLKGTGFVASPGLSGAVEIVREHKKTSEATESPIKVAAAAPRPAMPAAPSIETVVVTAQHKSENIQSVPIAITALSQQQLTERQIAGGPDLVKEVPNLTFSKTNFSGYNLEIRGIGTQAISVTTDPAVAVAFNSIPFIRNHFFEQEFYDLSDAEVLRGPQGTLYGRNATAGVVNIESAKPTDTYEAMLSADFGNYSNRRLEGMLNLPIVGDTLDLRIAGEWTKREGYDTDTLLNTSVDGRDLWSGRVTLGWKPASNVQTSLVWEHFSEDDGRLRSGKQLCEQAPIPSWAQSSLSNWDGVGHFLSQGCLPSTSLYAPTAFQVPNGNALTYYFALALDPANGIQGNGFNPYAGTTQSTNLRDIESAILPQYRAKNDTLEYNADWKIASGLTFTSQTGYNHDFLWSTEDYNRFDSAPGAFVYDPTQFYASVGVILPDPAAGKNGVPSNAGIFCDPQLGCSDRLLLQDLSTEHAWQLSQEFRLASSFSGPLNFSFGVNGLHYETVEDYYVFVNSLSLFNVTQGIIGLTAPPIPIYNASTYTNSGCLLGNERYTTYQYTEAEVIGCAYTDPNPISSVNGEGHNYFLSQNPYVLNSYATFGEVYYNVTNDLKLTTGLRFTDDQKHFDIVPSQLLIPGYGYPETGQTNQRWDQFTGREVLDWTPKLDFTDQSLFYASYAHGYKAGGANPPGAFYPEAGTTASLVNLNPIHPLTFAPEFIEAFELGTKNSLLGNSLTLNGDIFYYNYTGYQISEIVDRTAINNNYNAHVEGAEFEGNWEPLPGLKFSLAQGFENTGLASGDEGIDLMDRSAGNPNWVVVKPTVTTSSNCILPLYVAEAVASIPGGVGETLCTDAYQRQLDPVTGSPYVPYPTAGNGSTPIPAGYPGFNPLTAPNNGEGFDKNLAGNQLPNAPHFTTSLTAEYTMPVSDDWAATLHGDFYWQSQQWARVFEDPIDKIHGYSTTNVSLILTSDNGWQVMAYVKNVFNVTAITGTFLNSDDSGLTTNVFLTDPRLFGIRVTKQLDENDGFWGSEYSGNDFFTELFSDTDNGKPPLWIELGGQLAQLQNGQQTLALPFKPTFAGGSSPAQTEQPIRLGLEEEAKVSWEPDGSDWIFSGGIQYGRTGVDRHQHLQTNNKIVHISPGVINLCNFRQPTNPCTGYYPLGNVKFAETEAHQSQSHTILDFLVGKDVGLGMFGMPGSSVVSAGVRIAQLMSKSDFNTDADPDLQYPTAPITNQAQKYQFVHDSKIHFHNDTQAESRKESFHGLGPELAWNASTPMGGNDADNGEIAFDWGANFSVLLGRQTMREQHQTVVKSYYLSGWKNLVAGSVKPGESKLLPGCFAGRYDNYGAGACNNHAPPDRPAAQHTNAASLHRSRLVTVPNLGAFAALSWQYKNAKVSFGYRADEFFGAMDGGIDTYKSYNRGFFGPYANISIGVGG